LGTCVLRCFSNWQSTRQLLIGLDVRAGIKADGFDFYVINCKPYGLLINRPHPLNSPLFRLFPFESMHAEGLRLDLSIFPSRGCVSMNSKNSKFPCFPLIFSKDYHCQVISRSKSIALSALCGHALMNKVQFLENSSSGRNHLLPWNTQSHWVSIFISIEEIRSLDLLLKSDWCARVQKSRVLDFLMKRELTDFKL